MHVIVAFTIVPLGAGLSLSPFVAEVERELEASGLTHELHANGTDVEGEWDEVMAAIRRCHERLHALAYARASPALARPILGSSRAAASLVSRRELLDFVGEHYVTGRAVVAAAGPVNHDELVHAARE